MALLELFLNYWWVLAAGYCAALAVAVGLYVRSDLRANGYRLRYSRANGFHPVRTDAGSYGDGNGDCAANLNRAVHRGDRRRSMGRPPGRHDAAAVPALGAGVLANETAVVP